MVSPPPHRTNSTPAALVTECDPPKCEGNYKVRNSHKNDHYLYSLLAKIYGIRWKTVGKKHSFHIRYLAHN